MFKRAAKKAGEALQNLDFTQSARDPAPFKLAQLAELGLGAEMTAMAYDPVQGILACATSGGRIHVFGAPGVHVMWDLGMPSKVRYLAFKPGSGLLLTIDAKDTLAVYDLTNLVEGKPSRASSISLRTVTTCVETSASYSHAFLGGRDGTVEIYDIDRGVLVPQSRIPNLWISQEEILRRSGVSGAPSRRHIPVCTDVKAHPTDVSLLLIAYEGGVALWNIVEKEAIRAWEFVLPPGAPGGGNDAEEALFSERRPTVTSLAWRPDGLVFAAGHDDGCISFCSIADEHPISIRTIERADVNKTTEEDLFGWSAEGAGGGRSLTSREPIFRLAWSGFPEDSYYDKFWVAGTGNGPDEASRRRGGTILTVLGGLLPKDPKGVHLLEFPPYVPPAAIPAHKSKPRIMRKSSKQANDNTNIPSALRQALKDSVTPIQHDLYPTISPPEDFLLLPRSTPHGGMAYDPTAIIITTGADLSIAVLPAPHSSRGLEAWSFPPTVSAPPKELMLPPALSWSGAGTCTSCHIVNLPTLSYRRLIHQFETSDPMDRLPIYGGTAFLKKVYGAENYEQPRVLVSLHVDLTVRFWDVSNSLLRTRGENGRGLATDFPRPLVHLTMNVKDLLKDAATSALVASRLLRERPWELELVKVSLAVETLELAVTINTGELVVSRIGYGDKNARRSRKSSQPTKVADLPAIPSRSRSDDSSSSFPFVASPGESSQSAGVSPPPAYAPPTPPAARKFSLGRKMTLTAGKKKAESPSKTSSLIPPVEKQLDPQDSCIQLSGAQIDRPDLDGFRPVAAIIFPTGTTTCLAMSDIGFVALSADANLVIVDLRGPEVLWLEDVDGAKSGKGKGKRSDSRPITSLTWAIGAVGDDHDRNPRLIVVQASGATRVFEFAQVAGAWVLAESVPAFQHDNVAGTFASFVFDRLGTQSTATPIHLQQALTQQASLSHDTIDQKGSLLSLWVAVTPSTISCYYNINGPRVAIYDGGSSGFLHAQIVLKGNMPVLVVSARDRTITSFALPELSSISRVSIMAPLHTSSGDISFAQDGSLVQSTDPLSIKLYTIFDTLTRPVLVYTLHDNNIYIPAQVDMVTSAKSTVASLFGGGRVYLAAEIDSALGGENRPPPKSRAQPQVAPPRVRAAPRPRQDHVYEDVLSTRDTIGRTNEALEERGDSLGYLSERLGQMSSDAAKFASDTKKLAQREAAKKTLAAGFSSLFK